MTEHNRTDCGGECHADCEEITMTACELAKVKGAAEARNDLGVYSTLCPKCFAVWHGVGKQPPTKECRECHTTRIADDAHNAALVEAAEEMAHSWAAGNGERVDEILSLRRDITTDIDKTPDKG